MLPLEVHCPLSPNISATPVSFLPTFRFHLNTLNNHQLHHLVITETQLRSTTTGNGNPPTVQTSTANQTYANYSTINILSRGPPWRINPSSELRRHVCRLTAGSHTTAIEHGLCLQPTTHANFAFQELSDIQKNSDLCMHNPLAHATLLC